jgi:hypothetical protein
MVSQGPPQQPRGDEDTDEVDRQQNPGNPSRPIVSDGTGLQFQEQVSTRRTDSSAARDAQNRL